MKFLIASTALLCIFVPATESREQTAQGSPPACLPTALDATIAFSSPPGEHEVAINYRNISDTTCLAVGGIGAMFDNWHEGHNIWAKECRNCRRSETDQPGQSLALLPGESGYFLLRWKSVSDGTERCIDADGFNTNDVTVVAPSLLDKVCSAVDERSFLPGTFHANGPDSDPDTGYSIELSAPDSVLHAGDSFPFRALVSDPDGHLALDDHSCPITFIRTRDESGSTTYFTLR